MFERFRSRSRTGLASQGRAGITPVPAIRALEPRFVFDGAAAPAAAQAQSDAAAQSHGDQTEKGADASHAEAADRQTAAPAAAAPGHETASANGRHEIVVIDSGVADLATLLAGVPASAEVILIESGRDGFDQLAEALKGRSGIDAIHILSHGSAGDLRLGTGDLTADTIQGRYADDLAVIGRALTASGDLLIYGCDFAAGTVGARAAALLAQATGADVAASDDATGDSALGGDWDLEVHDGQIETGVVISEAAQRDWHHLLAAAADNGRGALLGVLGRTIYSIDIATGKATALTTAPASVGGITLGNDLNSLAVDQANGLIYYVDNGSPNSANKNALFAYDFRNDQHILIDADLSDNGVTTGTQGLGSAGAAFANGTLYLAVEDVSGTTDQIYKLTFTGNGRTVASASTFGNQSNHNYNWGDITIDVANNQLISVTGSNYARFNLTTGAEISYAATTRTDFQTGFDQGGLIYTLGGNITRINPTDGTAAGPSVAITTDGSTGLGGLNDAASWTPPTSTIGGRVFADSNANGTSDSGEGGLQGITVQLVDDVNGNGQADSGERVLATDTTAADGSYSFTGLLPGQFVVRVTDAEGRLATARATTPTSGALTDSKVGATLAGPNFGYNPALVLDLDQSAAGTGYATSYTERAPGVAIVDGDVSITDVASTTLSSARAVITNGSAGDTLAIAGTLPAGIGAAFDPSTYTLTLTGTASTADYQTALQQIRFSSAERDPSTATRSIAVTLNDGSIDSNAATTTVAFTAVDDPPVNTVPSAQSLNEDSTFVFSQANGSAISIADPDARSGSLTTTLSVGHGILTLGSTSGVTVTGNGTGTVSVTGTVAAVNAALDGTAYRPSANYNGADRVTVTTNDNGNTGTGGPQTDTDTVDLTVVPVADPPQNNVPAGTQAATEDTPLVFSSASGNPVSVTDVDGNGLTVTLSSAQGRLTLSRLTGLTFTAGDGTGDATMTFSGSAADINAALDGLRFDPSADYNGSADISLVTRGPVRAADNFTNGGFENPVIAGNTFQIVPDSTVPGWDTDASDHDIEIWKSGYNGVTAYEGNQFAEINANQVAALYQTFDAAAGSTISLDFAHRGRQGVDTMQVVVTDLGADGTFGTADDRVLLDKTYSDGNTAWGAYSEELAQNASGNKLRFEFRSVSAAGGSPSIGNFVDGIQIKQSFVTKSDIAVAIAPVADIVPDSVATDEEAPITFNALTGTNGASADNFEDPSAYVSSVTQGAHGSVTFAPDGTMTYTPVRDFNGTDSFTYTVTSGGTTETATVTVTVRPVNDAPVLDLDASAAGSGYATSYTERAPGVAIVDADVSVTDVDNATMASARAVITNGKPGDTLSIAGTLPAGIAATFDSTTYTLRLTGSASNADYQTALQQIRFSSAERDPSTDTRSIAVTVNDGALDSAVATTAIAFTAVNDAPINGMPGNQSLSEDGSLVFSSANLNPLTVADADAQGGDLTTTISVAHGTLTLGAPDGVTVTNDGSRSVTLTGSVAAINAALDGTRYRPDADYNGSDTLTMLTNDNGHTGSGGAQTDTDAIALAIAAVNDAPRAGTLPALGSLEGATIPATDLGRYFSDVDGDVLSFGAAGLPAGLTIDPATGIVSGTVDRSAALGATNGDYTVTITADDGHGGLTSRSFVWRVVNPSPIARDDAVLVNAANTATGSVLADNGNGPDVDPDGDPLSVSAVNGAPAGVGQPVAGSAGGLFTVRADGSYSFDPNGDFADLAPGQTRTTRVTYTLSDGEGGVSQATFAVIVTGRDAAPAALVPGDRAASEGDTVALPFGSLFPNPGGGAKSYAATGLPPGLAIDPATGLVTGTIDHTASGPTGLADYRVTVTATDAQGATETRTFTFRVTNPAPQAADERATTAEDVPVTVDVLSGAADPDGDTLTIVSAGSGAPSAGHGTVAVVNGRLVYTPAPGFNGTDTVTYTIDDGNGGRSTASVVVTVTPVNDAPDAGTLPDQYGRDGASVRYDLSSRFHDTDTDPSVVQTPSGDALTFTATGLPTGLTIDPTTGVITGTLPTDAAPVTRYTVTVTATDRSGASVTRGFTWTVSDGAPIAAPDSATTSQGSPVLVSVTANDSDPEGGAVSLVDEPGATSAAHGTVSVDPATGLLTYTPQAGFSGRDTVVYTIADAQGTRSTGILTVNVTPVNQRPVAPETLPTRNGTDGETVRVPLGNLVSDPDGDRLAYAATGLPPGLAIDPATGEITGTIDRAASGPSGRATYVVTLTATDPGGLAVTRSFAWTVTDIAPVAADDAITTAEDTPVDIDVTGNDSDPDGDALAVVPGSMAASHGTVTLNPDGSLHYVPDRDFNGTDRIVYTITDGNGGFATASATVTVTAVNDAPTFDSSSPALADRSATDAQTVSIPAGGAFRDVDAGDRLSFTATGLPPGLSVDPATGAISGTIASDASTRVPGGVYTIRLTATDLSGASATAQLTITVTNPAPIAADDAVTLDEDTPFTGSVLGNDRDPDGDALRVETVPVAAPAHGRLDLRPDGTFTYTPDADFHGSDSFTYALVDSDGGRATATVRLTVASVNDAPVATVGPLRTQEDTAVDGRIVASDRDGDPLTYTVETPPGSGRVTLRPDGSFTFQPGRDFNGTDSFVVRVSDGQGGFVLVPVSVTVDAVNDAPDVSADPLVVTANTIGTGKIVAADRDGDPLGFRVTAQPQNGTLVLAADGSYSYTPFAAYSGADRFTVEVSDGQGGVTAVTVEITVAPNPVQVPPGPLNPILAPPPPFEDGPAAPPVLPPESTLATSGFILPALAEIDVLDSVGNVVLADGAVVAAVNGVAPLHGTTIFLDRPIVLDEGDRIARLSWDDFERAPVDETPWFSPRPYLGRSLGIPLMGGERGFGELMVEAIRRPDSLTINLRNMAPDRGGVAEVRLLGVGGAPPPDWIEGDGEGGFWGRPPAGTGLVRIELEIVMEDGRVLRRPITVDAETGEVRALPESRRPAEPDPSATRRPEAAPMFTTRLAALDAQRSQDIALIERALTRDR